MERQPLEKKLYLKINEWICYEKYSDIDFENFFSQLPYFITFFPDINILLPPFLFLKNSLLKKGYKLFLKISGVRKRKVDKLLSQSISMKSFERLVLKYNLYELFKYKNSLKTQFENVYHYYFLSNIKGKTTKETFEILKNLLQDIYEKENRRQEIIDKKGHNSFQFISVFTTVISILIGVTTQTFLNDLQDKEKCFFFVFTIFSLSFLFLSIFFSIKVVYPIKYRRPRQFDFSEYEINSEEDVYEVYMDSIYEALTENQKVNSKKGKDLSKCNIFFILGILFFLLLVFLFVKTAYVS